MRISALSVRLICCLLVPLFAVAPVRSAPRKAATQPATQVRGRIDQIKARGIVRCGSVERPGVAIADGSGHWRGVAVDVCRAVAAAVLGSPDRIDYDDYVSPKDYDRVRREVDDVAFLTGREMLNQDLIRSVVPGPTVVIASDSVMVPGNSPVQHVAELAGKGVCFLIGDTAEHSVESFFDAAKLDFVRHPYSEPGEMEDAYAVQRCHAIAAETTELARVRLLNAPARLNSRILPEPLNVFPLVAATPQGDGQWTAAVAWIVNTLIDAERPDTKWFSGGVKAMPIAGADLGLSADWEQRMIRAVGHYGQIYDRNLGKDSPYRLERGLNANQLSGGLMLAPFVE